MTVLSVRNCNPLNIRPGSPWEGLANPAQDGGFCKFISPVFGFRAVFKNYIAKSDRGVNTIRALITEWAPPTDNNDTEAYIASVSKATGFKPDDVINLKSWDVGSAVCYAQTVVESGQPFEANWKMADMAEGALRAGIVDAPKSPIRKLGVVASSTAAAAIANAPAIVDAINTNVTPVVAQSHMPLLTQLCAVLAGVFALLAIFNHIRAATK